MFTHLSYTEPILIRRSLPQSFKRHNAHMHMMLEKKPLVSFLGYRHFYCVLECMLCESDGTGGMPAPVFDSQRKLPMQFSAYPVWVQAA